MAYNIGPKIGIDGEKEFRDQIKAINNEYRTLQAETKALTAEFVKNGDQQGLLTMQTQQLEKQIDVQKRAIEEMEKALEKAKATTDADSDAVTNWQGKLYNAKAAVFTLEKELQDTEGALEDLKQATQESDAALDAMAAEAAIFKDLESRVKPISNEFKTLQAQTRALTAEFDKNDEQQDKLRVQAEQLEKQIDAQKRAIQEMEKALKLAENTTDANSYAVVTWRGKLYDAQATVSKLEKELADTEDELRKMEEGIEDTGDAAEDAGDDVSEFGDILKGNLAADAVWDALKEGAQLLKELGESAVEAAAEVRAEGAQFEQTFGEMEQAATASLQNLEAKTGISSTRIKGNFSTVYAFAKTMGAESEDALDIASRAMTAAADSAAYYDKTVEEVTETIQAYIKGNYANDAALGIASTETTRNAAALERYGKAFQDLTEAQKVDTLLAMVEAGNKASGAMGQAAREAGEWTNVTAELEDAQQQLLAVIGEPILEEAVPIVQELTQAMRELAEVSAGEALEQDMESFADAMQAAENAYKSTETATTATATVAEQYVNRLRELEEAGLDTAQAQEEYRATVEKLQIVMPELNLSISTQTGLLEQNTSAILDQVEAWKQAAIQAAMYEKLTTQLEAYGEAKVSLAEAEQKQLELEAQQQTQLQTLAATLGVVGAASIKTRTIVSESLPGIADTTVYEIFDKAGNKLATLSDTIFQADSQAVKLAKDYNKTTAELGKLEKEIDATNETLAGHEEQIDAATEAISDYEEQNLDAAESQETQNQAMAETQAALLELEAAYRDAEQSTRAMLDSAIGLWDEMAKESDWTAGKVLQNWRDQMAAFDSYSANLKKAKDMGLADGIIEALSDGSQQSMQILDAMVNQSQYSVGEINAAFTDLDLAKDGTAAALVKLDASLQEGYDKLIEDARAAGVEIVDVIAQAIEDNAYKVADALGTDFDEEYLSDAEDLSDAVTNPHYQARQQAGSSNKNYYNFEITQLPGEDSEEFAYRVAGIIQDETERKAGGLGG